MARIPNDEWLHFAKATPIGGQRRVRHGREDRDNMVVKNLPDKWVAFCQRCKTGAVEPKSHVMIGAPAPKDSASLSHPTDARAIVTFPMYVQEALTGFIARKSMDWWYFGDVPVTWSPTRQRLLLHTPQGLMGRDTTERSAQKWLTYDRQHYVGQGNTSDNVVLVEDCFSWLKVSHSTQRAGIDCAVYCTLGTAIHDSLYLRILQTRAKRVVSFYDGDSAGWDGAQKNSARLRAGGIHIAEGAAQCAPHGLDPKDMGLNDIAEHVAGLLTI